MHRYLITAAVVLLCCYLGSPVFGAEFQPMGAVGIGGAGVARMKDGFAPYWNPAGLAFNEKAYSTRIEAGVGVRLNNGLAENIDSLGKIDFDAVSNLANSNSAGITASQFGDAIKLVAILEDIKAKGGALTANGNAVFGNQIKHFGFGAYGSLEATAIPSPDTTRVLLADGNIPGAITSISGLADPGSNGYFSAAQRSQLTTALTGAGFSNTDSIINTAASQLANSGVSSTNAVAALTNVAAAFASGATALNISNNQSSIITRGLAYMEIPLSYGHPVDLGAFGKLGIGGSVKLIPARVYSTSLSIFNTDSGSIVRDLTESYTDSTSWGVDCGLLWKPKNWLAVGVVGKNLNTPKFKAQDGDELKIKPQARLGVAWDPFSWLTFAADLDLTKNETLLPGYYSRHLGGGLELHPFNWLKLRGGGYKNMAQGDIGPVVTAGLTFGTKWVNLDVDGAYGLEKGRYNDQDFPKESRAQVNLNIQF